MSPSFKRVPYGLVFAKERKIKTPVPLAFIVMMAGFHFTDQKLSNDLISSIASLLDSIGVPTLLWGNYLLTVYGVPTIVDVSILLFAGASTNVLTGSSFCYSG